MSTKIYFAYRCPIRTFPEVFLPAFREHCFRQVAKRCRKLMAEVPEEAIRKAQSKSSGEKNANVLRAREVLRHAVKAGKSPECNPWYDFSCSLNVWLYQGKAYIIPSGESWIYEEFLPEGIEEYSYYNNVDHPKHLTSKQWKARGKMWGKVCLDVSWDAGRLQHEILKFGAGYSYQRVGVEELVRRLLPGQNYLAAMWGLDD